MANDIHRPVRSEDDALQSITEMQSAPLATEIALPEYAGVRERALARPVRMRAMNVVGGGPMLLEGAPDALETAAEVQTAPVDASVASFGETQLLEVVIGNDDRTRVSDADLKLNPWRQICALRITAQNNQSFVGTGWFIGNRTIVTAGHCVFLHKHGGWAKSVEVIPAMNASSRPFGSVFSNRLRTVVGWAEDMRKECDYAVIQLPSDKLGKKLGFFTVASLEDSGLVETIANVSGYPADLDRAERQYFHARKLLKVSSQFLFYDIDTFGGQSGSPVFQKLSSGEVRAVGVHTTGSAVENSATRITDRILDNFVTWKEEN